MLALVLILDAIPAAAEPPTAATGRTAEPPDVIVPPEYSDPHDPRAYLASTDQARPGTNPWATPEVVAPPRYARVSAPLRSPAGTSMDPQSYADYQRLPSRAPHVALVVFGTLGIVTGLPSLVQELRYPSHDRGTLIYGAVLTGLGTFIVSIATYKLVVRHRGLKKLRARGYNVALGPSSGGGVAADFALRF